jgi:hypothetical protein
MTNGRFPVMSRRGLELSAEGFRVRTGEQAERCAEPDDWQEEQSEHPTQAMGRCYLINRDTLLLRVLYSVRSERILMERISYNMLFRWFVGLSMDDSV